MVHCIPVERILYGHKHLFDPTSVVTQKLIFCDFRRVGVGDSLNSDGDTPAPAVVDQLSQNHGRDCDSVFVALNSQPQTYSCFFPERRGISNGLPICSFHFFFCFSVKSLSAASLVSASVAAILR